MWQAAVDAPLMNFEQITKSSCCVQKVPCTRAQMSQSKTPHHGVTLTLTESRSYLITVFTVSCTSLERLKAFSTACFFLDLMECSVFFCRHQLVYYEESCWCFHKTTLTCFLSVFKYLRQGKRCRSCHWCKASFILVWLSFGSNGFVYTQKIHV